MFRVHLKPLKEAREKKKAEEVAALVEQVRSLPSLKRSREKMSTHGLTGAQ